MCIQGRNCPVRWRSAKARPDSGGGRLSSLHPTQGHHHHFLHRIFPLLNLLPPTSHHLFLICLCELFQETINPVVFNSRKNGFAPVLGIWGLLSIGGGLCETGGLCPALEAQDWGPPLWLSPVWAPLCPEASQECGRHYHSFLFFPEPCYFSSQFSAPQCSRVRSSYTWKHCRWQAPRTSLLKDGRMRQVSGPCNLCTAHRSPTEGASGCYTPAELCS